MVKNNILYDKKRDILYILIYKLGSGACSIVWYGLEIENFIDKMKNKKKPKYNCKAIKIHFDN